MSELTFAQKLRALRESAGLTQGQLADKIQTTIRSISRLETGAQEPTWPVVQALSDALCVGCEEFRGQVGAPQEHRGRGRPSKGETEPAPRKPAKAKRRSG